MPGLRVRLAGGVGPEVLDSRLRALGAPTEGFRSKLFAVSLGGLTEPAVRCAVDAAEKPEKSVEDSQRVRGTAGNVKVDRDVFRYAAA
jgi:hypothetical protein